MTCGAGIGPVGSWINGPSMAGATTGGAFTGGAGSGSGPVYGRTTL